MRITKLIEDGKEIIEEGKEVIVERKELVEDLFDKTEEYIKTNVQLAKLKATDKVADVASALIANAAIVILSFFFLLMVNMGIAFWIGSAMGQYYYGFLIVAGFYALLAAVLFIFRVDIIQTPISNSIILQVLKDKSNGQNKSN